MTLSFRTKIREVTAVAILDFLKAQGPSTAADLQMLLEVPRGSGVQTVLPELEQSGLIIRQQDPTLGMGKAKPYSITPEGERYLETAKQKTLTLGADGGLGWAARGRDPELHQAIVDLLVRNSLLGKENEPSLHRLASDIIDVVERNNKRQR